MASLKEVMTDAEILTQQDLKKEILNDYRIANESRQASLLGRREVLTGKAKFGIFGDGKEIPQIALAKQFQNGDFRSGYYRDQTWLMAAGLLTLREFFGQLYANTDMNEDPHSAGRQMNCHFASHSLDDNGDWKDLTKQKNSAADISPTAGQMTRMVGLGLASKVYRQHELLKEIEHFKKFSNNGNEIVFGSIGDASTSEGPFWETINAIGVLQVPAVISVWDDGYGISVEKKYQTTKESISEVLKGFQRTNGSNGYEIFRVKGWDYAQLCLTYEKAAEIAREQHVPVLIHVEEVTQPQGHSTSGSHERYKSPERLAWENEYDGIRKFREWILSKELATAEELDQIENDAKKAVRDAKKEAWKAFYNPIKEEIEQGLSMINKLASVCDKKAFIEKEIEHFRKEDTPLRRDIAALVRKVLYLTYDVDKPERKSLLKWMEDYVGRNKHVYSTNLYSETQWSPLKIEEIKPVYGNEVVMKDGREILRDNFDKLLEKYPELLIFGEDSGKIGGVNQGLEGLQAKYGELRVSDTGIREATIIGQGIGLAMRGLRPIAEIQYLDYVNYCLQVMADDLATLRYRTNGKQKAPVIIRTRGHRLEGIWHSGSLMGMILNAVRGIHVCVPRNLTQAAGMYNTLLMGDDPALVVESLNGYRIKERVPENLGEFRVPLGKVEIMTEGTDITLVTYGSLVRIAEESVKQLRTIGISVELIDIQTLLPFDLDMDIAKSLAKTNRLLIVDEDVPGGASAYILDKIMENEDGYFHLDEKPETLTGTEHRPPYGSDGDYFSKPSAEDITERVYNIMHRSDPARFPGKY